MLPETFTPEFLRQLELLKIRSRRAYLGSRQGGHVSPKRGHGIEFSDYRMYELGDSPRWIDWGVYARTDRLYVRRYQEEQNLSILIIIDTSASMLALPEDRKWERAVEMALVLSYVGLMEHDSIVVAAPGYYLSPRLSGAKAIHTLGSALQKVRPDGRAVDFAYEFSRAASHVRFPGVAVFISDLLMPIVDVRRLFSVLLARNLDVTALQILGPADTDPLEQSAEVIAVDSENGEELQLALDPDQRAHYQHLLAAHNAQLQEFFAERRVGFVRTSSKAALREYVATVLEQSGLLA